MPQIDDVVHLLCCPDDGSFLTAVDGSLDCSRCARKFPVNKNIIDLRPISWTFINEDGDVEAKYSQLYQNLIGGGSLGKDKTPFGLVSRSVSPGFFKETVSYLAKRITKDFIVCDVGAGSGDYSVELARSCKVMFHCDLAIDAIVVAQRNAELKGVNNIFFLRCDYFRLPFLSHVLDYVYTIDVLERGAKHDRHLLGEIAKMVRSGGNVCFDCHSKERSKLTKIEGAGDRYSKEEIACLAREHSLEVVNISGTGFIPQMRVWSAVEYRFLNFLAKTLRFPPARWLLFCRVS